MALIKCPECGGQVSSSAVSCPKCAYPISGGGSTKTHGGKIQTVEQTSKKYKQQQVFSALLIGGGAAVVMNEYWGGEPSAAMTIIGTLGVFVGAIWHLGVRVMVWWDHG